MAHIQIIRATPGFSHPFSFPLHSNFFTDTVVSVHFLELSESGEIFKNWTNLFYHCEKASAINALSCQVSEDQLPPKPMLLYILYEWENVM